jgi:NAD(P)H-dependent FMN reductase
MTADPAIEVLRSAADALTVDLPAWEARDPGDPSPEARRALRSAIATADAVIIVMSGLRSRLGGERL